MPAPLLATRPETPWKQIIAGGNVLRHNYDSIVDRLIYEVVTRDLPPLQVAVAAIEADLDEPRE